jgi:D-aminoacyl-tRNA deacylase
MRAVIQRVKSCSVSIEGQVVSEIGTGLLVLLGVARDDKPSVLAFLSDKVLNLRIFPDSEGKMNLSVLDINAELMVVSQFTLLADCRKGRRPSLVDAADPAIAEPLYEEYVSHLAASGLKVATGVFGAMMDVRLENWGPVTFIIDSPWRDKV